MHCAVFEFLFNDTSTLTSHFMSSPREREKKNRGASDKRKERNEEG